MTPERLEELKNYLRSWSVEDILEFRVEDVNELIAEVERLQSLVSCYRMCCICLDHDNGKEDTP